MPALIALVTGGNREIGSSAAEAFAIRLRRPAQRNLEPLQK
jgi:NAD(P)-dependent dehydrogenase (short-subunit alcohol dehydrogenase family)